MFCGPAECDQAFAGRARLATTDMADTDSQPTTAGPPGKPSTLRGLFRSLWAISCFLGGAYFLIPSVGHWWAAGFPPPEIARWHEAWCNVFFAIAIGLWVVGALGVWFMRPRRARSAMRQQA